MSHETTPHAESDDLTDDHSEDGLGSLAQAARTDHLRSARITMYVIGAITVAANLFVAFSAKTTIDNQFDKEAQKLQQQGMIIDNEELDLLKSESLAATQLLSYGFAGLGIVFFILGAMVYQYPVPCTVLALVLYLAGQAITAMSDPSFLVRGIIIKIIIIVALVKAVQAAVAYRQEQLVSTT